MRLLPFLACASAVATEPRRVALIFRGRHASVPRGGAPAHELWRGTHSAHRRLLVEPLIEQGAIVDILVSSPNSSSWHAMENDYRHLVSAGGAFGGARKESHTSSEGGHHGEEAIVALKFAQSTCRERRLLEASLTKEAPSQVPCWDAIVVWHFGVTPLVAAAELHFEKDTVVVPWREAGWELPTTEATVTTQQINKACMAYRNKYEADARGWRAAFATFWFDGGLLDTVISSLSSGSVSGGTGSGDPHYMFNSLRADHKMRFAFEGYWETAHSNPLLIVGHHGGSASAANFGTDNTGMSAAGANGAYRVHRCCAQTSNDAVGQLERASKEHSKGWGTLGTLVSGSDVASSAAESIWAQRCPDDAATAANSGTTSLDTGGDEGNSGSKTGVKHALHAFENKLENVLAGHIGASSSEHHHHHHHGKGTDAHVPTGVSSHEKNEGTEAQAAPETNAVPTANNRFSAGVAWTNTTVAATDGKPSISLITPRHVQEIARQSAVQWDMYKPFEHRMKGMQTKEVRYDGTPCFGGCTPLKADNPAFQLTGRAAELAERHPPGSLSLVLPWCCEWVSFILQQIDFKGLLKEIYLYDKCSHTGLNAKDLFHVKQDLEMKLSDEKCRKPTRATIVESIGKNKQADVNKIDVHFVDLNERGRSSCMSTDECGAYLAHLVKYYDLLTDGIVFMQADPRHAPSGSVQQIVNWAASNQIAPINYYPLGSKQGAGGNPKNCLDDWQPLLFPGQPPTSVTRRTGNYRNGIFYASRLLVRSRPREFWFRLFELVNATEMCAPTFGGPTGDQHCKPEDHRPLKRAESPSLKFCKSGPFKCGKSCNALEHVWSHMFCMPCHNLPKGTDPRYPWNPAAKKHPQVKASTRHRQRRLLLPQGTTHSLMVGASSPTRRIQHWNVSVNSSTWHASASKDTHLSQRRDYLRSEDAIHRRS